MQKTLIVIAGPTAIGKTALAIQVAQHYKTEIVSADSRQFYREMEIGTAKPSPSELNAVKHHFINSHSVTDEITVGGFEAGALKVINHIFETHPIAVLVGGSGLFVKAVTQGFDELPKADPGVREELNTVFAEQGISALQEKLGVLDPEYYSQVDIHNPQRLIRALEVSISTGKPFSSFRANQPEPRPFNIIQIGLNTERGKLYERINHRVEEMLKAGLVAEVEGLVSYRSLNALNTVGYSEIFDFLDGLKPLAEAVDAIKQNTRRFAKRQLTWFRKDPEIQWFDPEQSAEIFSYISNKIR